MSDAQRIEELAIDWLIRKEEPDWSADDQARLNAWLDESMAHKAAFWRAEHGWREADRIGALGANDRDGLSDARRSHGWRWAAAAALVATVGLGMLEFLPRFGAPVEIRETRYDTPVGGRRVVPLPDGTKVELNTATVVRAAVTPARRDVWLDAGEAYFEVAHRDGQPFVVHAGHQTVTVLGTKFSVRRDNDRVVVNVLEGRVRVDDGEAKDARAAIISAGDVAIARGASTLIAAKSEERVEKALAWRDGVLSFDQTALSEVAAEFNRYNRRPILIVDPEAAQIRIGGSFQAANVDAFVRLLRDAYGLHIEEDDKGVKISS